jgi:hypothetical protein
MSLSISLAIAIISLDIDFARTDSTDSPFPAVLE